MREGFDALSQAYDSVSREHLRHDYAMLGRHRGPEDLALAADEYARVHAEHDAWLESYARQSGLRDVFVVRDDGHVIYSVNKGRHFATSLVDAKADGDPLWMGLANVVDEARALAGSSGLALQHDQSLLGTPITYVAVPIVGRLGDTLGVLAVETTSFGAPSVGAREVEATPFAWEALLVLAGAAVALGLMIRLLVRNERAAPLVKREELGWLTSVAPRAPATAARRDSEEVGPEAHDAPQDEEPEIVASRPQRGQSESQEEAHGKGGEKLRAESQRSGRFSVASGERVEDEEEQKCDLAERGS